MLKIVKMFNVHDVNDGTNYRAGIVNSNALPAAKPVFIEHQWADAVDSGAWSVEVSNIALYIRIVNKANFNSLTSQLKNWFKRGTRGDLVVTFTDEGIDYLKNCRVLNLVPDPDYEGAWIALLQTGATAWRAVNANTYAWNLSGTGGLHTEILPAADDETRLSMEFNAGLLPAVGYLYQRLYRLVPPGGITLGVRPWCVDIDTAGLIADNANKCQINQVGGIGAGDVTIPYDTVTGSIPSIGVGYVDLEQIAWTGKTGTISGNLTGVTRGLHGTTAAAHADNAEIKLSHMQADCQDLRVFLGDIETRRWIISPNSASTKLWFNVDLKTGFRLTLGSAIAGAGNITVLQFKVDATHQQIINVMPVEGILYHGTEWISYRGKDATNCRLLNPTRGILSTTLQAHNVGDAFDFIPTAIKIVYGNSAVGDPANDDVYYDETKPLFDLTNSTNAQWVWNVTSLFFDPLGPNRPGAWQVEVIRLGNISATYEKSQMVDGGDPALGCKVGSFLRGATWAAENATIAWKFNSPIGIQQISATGKKYRNTSVFPTAAALQYQAVVAQTITSSYVVKKKKRSTTVYTTTTVYSTQWLSAWNEASPSVISTWEAWTHNTVSIPDTTTWVRFALGGAIAAMANAIAAFEALTVTVVFKTASVPSGSLLGETSNYHLDMQLTNNANGNSLKLNFPMQINIPFVVDGEDFTVQYEGVNAHNAMTLDDESRDVFVRLGAGANELEAVGADLGNVAVTLSYYRRRL